MVAKSRRSASPTRSGSRSADGTDELTTVETAYGPMGKWKARSLAIGWMQRKFDGARADAAAKAHDDLLSRMTGPGGTTPPPLAADTAPNGEERERGLAVDAEGLKLIEDAVAALEARLDRLEAVRRAEQALLDAEEGCTVEDESADNPATWH